MAITFGHLTTTNGWFIVRCNTWGVAKRQTRRKAGTQSRQALTLPQMEAKGGWAAEPPPWMKNIHGGGLSA